MNPNSPDSPARAPIAPPSLWLLSIITLIGSLSMHVFVPAMPQVATSLKASPFLVQLTLTTYVIGLGVGQLIHGPLSDRFGRRPVLIVGMSLYVIASLAAIAAPSISILIVARLFEAFGAASGVVLGRAIVRDLYHGDQATSMLSLLNLVVLLAPGLSPLIGGALSSFLSWRAIFSVLAVFGLFNLLTVYFRLPETVTGPERSLGAVMADYRTLISNSSFLGWAMAGGCTAASLYGFIGAAPFIFVHQLHRTAGEVGTYLALNIAGIAVGSFSARWLLGRIEPRAILVAGNAISAVGAALFVVFASQDTFSLSEVLSTMFVFTLGAGLVTPIAMARSLAVNPRIAGSAAGLYGCMQMVIGAICTSLAGFGSSPALAAGLTLLGGVIFTQACIYIAMQAKRTSAARQGRPRASSANVPETDI